MLAHRLAWILTYGSIPAGLYVLHHCDNPPCCHVIEVPEGDRVPDHPLGLWTNRDGRAGHLWLGTIPDNTADMVAKSRQRSNPLRGEAVKGAKLTRPLVLEILASSETQETLARRYGVARPTVADVKYRRTWKHIPWP